MDPQRITVAQACLDAGIRQPCQIPDPSYDDMAGWGHVDHKAFIKNSLRKRATGEQVA